jgi:hypothetical protein
MVNTVPTVGFLSAEVVKLADTPSPRRPLLNPRNPKKTNSFFFDFNKLNFRGRSRQQPPVGTRCRQSVQNPVQSVGLNAWLGAAVSCLSARATRTRRLETQQAFRRLTCLKLVGTGLIVGAPPLEHPRAAPRIAIRNPSAPLSSVALPLSTGSFNPATGQEHGAWT